MEIWYLTHVVLSNKKKCIRFSEKTVFGPMKQYEKFLDNFFIKDIQQVRERCFPSQTTNLC